MDDALLDEWLTGRLDDGSESPRFALGWRTTRTPLGDARAYTPDTATLSAVLCKTLDVTANGVNVRLAHGIDGQADVRVVVAMYRLDAGGHRVLGGDKEPIVESPVMTRWRPKRGTLDVARHHGVAFAARTVDAAALAKAQELDVRGPKINAEKTAEALAALKLQRLALLDMAEVGAEVTAELSTLESKVRKVRAAHLEMGDALNAEIVAAQVNPLASQLAADEAAKGKEP